MSATEEKVTKTEESKAPLANAKPAQIESPLKQTPPSPKETETEKKKEKEKEKEKEKVKEKEKENESKLDVSGATEVKMCGPCSKDETEVREENHPFGTAFCYECNDYLCAECVKFHAKFKVTCTHRVVDVDEVEDDVSYMDMLQSIEQCSHHPQKVIEYFCRDHDFLCCSKCVIGMHRRCGHVTTMVKHSKNVREENKFERVKHDLTRFLKHIDSVATKDSENLEALETDLTEVPRKLEDFRQRITRILETLESQTIEESEREYTAERAKLSEHLDTAKKLQKTMKESQMLMDHAIQQGSDSQLFIAMHVVYGRMEDYERALRNISSSAQNHRVELHVNEARLKSLEGALQVLTVCTERDSGHVPKRHPINDRPPRPTPENFFSRRRGHDSLVD